MLYFLLILTVGKETYVMSRFTTLLIVAIAVSILPGCASRRGFTFDGIHFIGGDRTHQEQEAEKPQEPVQPEQPIDWRYVAQK